MNSDAVDLSNLNVARLRLMMVRWRVRLVPLTSNELESFTRMRDTWRGQAWIVGHEPCNIGSHSKLVWDNSGEQCDKLS